MFEQYRSDFQTFLKKTHTQPESVKTLRKNAFNQFIKLGFPTTRMEDWRFTNVASIAKTPYRLPNSQKSKINVDALLPYSIPESQKVVILNGRLIPQLSNFTESVIIRPVSEVLEEYPQLINSNKSIFSNPFIALNTAFMEDGLFIQIPDQLVIESPLHLMYVSSEMRDNSVFHQRNLFKIGKNSHFTIVEHYIGIDSQDYFTNSVTDISVGENANLQHIKIQEESSWANHISTTEILQERNSRVSSHHLTVGGKLTRNEINVILNGEGCDTLLNGLNISSSQQHIDNHTTINHVEPNCTSREIIKHILNDRSRGVFNGRITVKDHAQKTDANQHNKNLLLSEHAVMNSNPQLEINADDVKCSHGSTTGKLDEDAIFYLRSRGIDLISAKLLLIKGFADEIIEKIQNKTVRNYLQIIISNRISTIGKK